jgi:3-deoxy-D-manno-octulosonic acid (KDO) 8-phosphate synthase
MTQNSADLKKGRGLSLKRVGGKLLYNNNNNNNNNNVVQKEGEKKLKYKSLCIEMQRMWNLKCTIIPVIIGATGIVTKNLRKNL